MGTNNKMLVRTLVVVFLLVLVVSLAGIMSMCHQPIVLQGQIEATEIRISGKLPGRIDTFYVSEGQQVKMGDTLVLINSPEVSAKLQQAIAMEDVAKYQNQKVDDGTRLQIVRTAEELWNKSKSDLQLAEVTYRRIQALYSDSVVSLQRMDEVEAVYKAALAAEQAAFQQYLLAKEGAQIQDKETARSLVDAAQGTVNEVQSILVDARLTAPADGEIATVYVKRGELVGTGSPIMNLVELADCHLVMNVREDYLPQFSMGSSFVGMVPALGNKEIVFRTYYINPLGSFATWKSNLQSGNYDMRTFQIKAKPVEYIVGLRPGMSVLVKL